MKEWPHHAAHSRKGAHEMRKLAAQVRTGDLTGVHVIPYRNIHLQDATVEDLKRALTERGCAALVWTPEAIAAIIRERVAYQLSEEDVAKLAVSAIGDIRDSLDDLSEQYARSMVDELTRILVKEDDDSVAGPAPGR